MFESLLESGRLRKGEKAGLAVVAGSVAVWGEVVVAPLAGQWGKMLGREGWGHDRDSPLGGSRRRRRWWQGS